MVHKRHNMRYDSTAMTILQTRYAPRTLEVILLDDEHCCSMIRSSGEKNRLVIWYMTEE